MTERIYVAVELATADPPSSAWRNRVRQGREGAL